MKRPSDNGGQDPSTSDNKLEAWLGAFLARHPRFFVYVGIGFVVLIVLAFLVAKFSAPGR